MNDAYEAERSCLGSLARGSVFLDVGANVGEISKLALSVSEIEPQDIHAFEPQPSCVRHLQKLGVRVSQVAVMDSEGEATLYGATDQPDQLASLRRRALDHYGIHHGCVEFRVETTTIDRYLAKNHIGYVDLVKIDVEGHESSVLRGARRALDTKAIGAVLFEHSPGWFFEDGYEPSFDEVGPLLGGYEIFAWGGGWYPRDPGRPASMFLARASA